MESGRGGDALRAARAAARAAREEARVAAELAETERDEPEAVAEPPAPEPAPAPPDDASGPPAWYPPLVGAWAAAVALMTTVESVVVRLVGVLVLVALAAGFFARFRDQRGMESGPLPDAFRVAAVGYAAVAVGAAVVAWFVGRTAAPVAGALAAFVLMTALVVAYERAYAAATHG